MKKIVEISSVDEYGEYKQDKVQTVFRENLTTDIVPEVGQQLLASADNSQQIPVIFVELNQKRDYLCYSYLGAKGFNF